MAQVRYQAKLDEIELLIGRRPSHAAPKARSPKPRSISPPPSAHSEQRTFGHFFKDAGYATCVVGKWQLGNDLPGPALFGFQENCLWQLIRRPGRSVSSSMT